MTRTSTLLALAFAAGSLVAPVATAQEVKPENRNAAIRYATIFYTADSEMLTKAAEVDLSVVGYDKAKAPEAFTATAELIRTKGEGTVGELIEASKLSRCDFELAYEKGFFLLLPHLSKMRSTVRMLRVDARRQLLDGKPDAAAENLAAMIRIAGHAKNDRILISSLVSAAICNAALDEAQGVLDAGLLTPEGKKVIAGALKSLPANDPFGMKGAMRGEQRLTLGWLKQTFHGDDAGKQLVKAGMIDGAESGSNPNAVKTVALMNEAQLHAAVDLLNPYYDQTIAAWDKPDSIEQLESLAKRVGNGEFGPLGQVLGPAVSKARASALKGEKRIEDMQQKLGAK